MNYHYPEQYHIAVQPSKHKYNITRDTIRDFGIVQHRYFITFTREEFDELGKEYGFWSERIYDGTVEKIKITNLDTRQERMFKFFGLIPQEKTSYDRNGLVFTSESNDHITLQII